LYGHLALQAAPDGNTYYISPNGNDNNSGATTNKPWATFNRAWQDLYPGDTLILMDGVYHQQIHPNKRNGQPGSPITIKAQNDGQAVIDAQGQFIPVRLGEAWPGPIGQYFVIEGIVARNSSDSVYEIMDDYNVLRRVSGYDAYTDGNAHVFDITGSNTLLEDCIAAGSGRKMIMSFQANNNVIRRCFSYWQSWDGRQWHDAWPWGDGIQIYYGNNNIIENGISYGPIPFQSISIIAPSPTNGAVGNKVLGSVAMGAGMNEDGTVTYWGCTQKPEPCGPQDRPQPTTYTNVRDFDNENQRAGFHLYGQGELRDNLFQDVIALGNAGLGFVYLPDPAGMHPGTSNNVVNRATLIDNGLDQPCTFGWPCIGGGLNTDILRWQMNKPGLQITNSFIENIYEGWPSYPNGSRTTSSTNGEGARMNNRYVDGALTSEPLWPWPMESRVQAELGFSLTDLMMQKLALNGYFLSTNTGARTIDPGGVATFRVDVEPSGAFSLPVSITIDNPSADLLVEPTTRTVSPPTAFQVRVTDLYTGLPSPPRTYTLRITADGGGMVKETTVRITVRAQYSLFIPAVILGQ
ncbi:MAG: hypothetical protein KC425_12320, partial [Anaerolineales bacterium]|nr:hypothetical protein [Anaerolineales bacterium]